MLTGKRPTDEMFKDNQNLHQFAKTLFPERVLEIIDHRLLSEEIENVSHDEYDNKMRSRMHESLVSLVRIGVLCSVESPKERMDMKDVVIELHGVRDFILSVEKY
ncbi:putative LRR receptor-like serine/threonine-protein kinase [Cinnamomum micranthum f. kanehirae]|uniref:Putative LRR receptor-like serine/threonine-protein kinase n=1 Tax=Cinnamomum micranthum f. kanehirae TaxID=337451 RepID=A0A3S4PJC1_9MAGN|nr:putative LRR receptor-like serine/threonine-protein kinase [Cinnamomum micranthum f. kanehirae]